MNELYLNTLARIIGKGMLASVVLALGACAVAPPRHHRTAPVVVFPPPPAKARFVFERALRSSFNVVKETSTARFRQWATGAERVSQEFAKPFGVVAEDGRVYVSDTVRRSVMVFDIRRKRFFQIGTERPGKLVMPLGLALDGQGNLYVCDGTAKRIVVYNKNGKYLRAIGGPKFFHRPSGVAVNRAGTRVFVVDTGGVYSQQHRICVFNARTGKHLFDFGKRGTGPGEFNLPGATAIGPKGLLYVVDDGNFRVEVFRQDGTFVRTFGAIGRRSGQFSRPKGIAVDAAGHVYVVDSNFGNAQIFTSHGRLLMAIGTRGTQCGPGEYMLPEGIYVDKSGRVYIVDQFCRKVDIYRPAGLVENTGRTAGHGASQGGAQATKP
jgi:DNA-binding beta-propeller fold protein YncE